MDGGSAFFHDQISTYVSDYWGALWELRAFLGAAKVSRVSWWEEVWIFKSAVNHSEYAVKIMIFVVVGWKEIATDEWREHTQVKWCTASLPAQWKIIQLVGLNSFSLSAFVTIWQTLIIGICFDCQIRCESRATNITNPHFTKIVTCPGSRVRIQEIIHRHHVRISPLFSVHPSHPDIDTPLAISELEILEYLHTNILLKQSLRIPPSLRLLLSMHPRMRHAWPEYRSIPLHTDDLRQILHS